MQPAEKQIGSKFARYSIGASILLLALMLFSELSCSLLGLCINWFPLAEVIGFWEMLGITTALVFSSFSIRALRHVRQAGSPSPEHSTPPVEDSLPVPDPHPAEQTAFVPQKRTGSWRDLFDQLSAEERENLKRIMEQHCVPPAARTREKKSESA